MKILSGLVSLVVVGLLLWFSAKTWYNWYYFGVLPWTGNVLKSGVEGQ